MQFNSFLSCAERTLGSVKRVDTLLLSAQRLFFIYAIPKRWGYSSSISMRGGGGGGGMDIETAGVFAGGSLSVRLVNKISSWS